MGKKDKKVTIQEPAEKLGAAGSTKKQKKAKQSVEEKEKATAKPTDVLASALYSLLSSS